MARSNVDAIYEEYPFLSRIIPRAKVQAAQVKRWNQDFLKESPITWWHERHVSKLYLLDKQGDIVGRVGESKWFKFWTRDETVAQALARIGDQAHRVRYAVELPDQELWFYKLPRDFTNAADWLCSIVEKAREGLRQP